MARKGCCVQHTHGFCTQPHRVLPPPLAHNPTPPSGYLTPGGTLNTQYLTPHVADPPQVADPLE